MAPPNTLSAYSDASSSYWPPGWNFARFANSTAEDNASLSDEERAKMQAGLRDVLGQNGIEELANIMWEEELRVMKEEQKRKTQQQDQGTAPTETVQQQQQSSVGSAGLKPAWLKASRQHYRDQPWGFVAFYLSPPPPSPATAGTASGDSDASTQQRQREKFQDTVWEITKAPFNAAVDEGHLEVNEARNSFEIKWVEVVTSADDDDATVLNHLRSRYREMRERQELPIGLDQSHFLVANASSVRSVLAGTESTTPGKYWRPDAPFLLAVAAEGELRPKDDGGGAREADEDSEQLRRELVFKVAVEALVEELWSAVDRQTISMETLTRFVRGARLVDDGDEERQTNDDLDDIWWSAHAPPRFRRNKRGI
ncbi:hypothetical protein Micbo1qcDRAFT_236837 [Microdochium bolleyi]|uniref:Uncharacterized protein n=1 Tax=Microdochium bolleyi TaxID=196109 RepID=A0A136INH1_9PEZI|nr:hypothetical protein Micbo1qcDRAFT_236837 [Microdochium bolleyi]